MKIAAHLTIICLTVIWPSLCQAQDPSSCVNASNSSSVASATNADGVGKAMVMLDRQTPVTLHATNEVRYASSPEKPSAPKEYGGLVEFNVVQSGTYQVGLSAGAWIDVVENGAIIESAAHGHGEGCLRKMVDFSLSPGRTLLQISGNAETAIMVMISRIP